MRVDRIGIGCNVVDSEIKQAHWGLLIRHDFRLLQAAGIQRKEKRARYRKRVTIAGIFVMPCDPICSALFGVKFSMRGAAKP